jgi:hypothetical protein
MAKAPLQQRQQHHCNVNKEASTRGHGGNHLALTQRHCHVVDGWANQARGCFYGCRHQHTSLKTVLFCKNVQSYKKNQNWRLSVHKHLNSMCTDDRQLMN